MKITRDYYPIADVAKIIGCSEDDLIHLGANNRVEIYALFAEPVTGERNRLLDLGSGGHDTCYGLGPFLLGWWELRLLEAGKEGIWCTTVWERDLGCSYPHAFTLLPPDEPDAHFPTPRKLVIMAHEVERLLTGRKTPAPRSQCVVLPTDQPAANATGQDLPPDSRRMSRLVFAAPEVNWVIDQDGEQDECAESVAPSLAQHPAGVTVTLPHLPRQLAVVFDVMWENWRDFDLNRPPKQINIARELDERLGFSPQKDGSPSRNAKTIAAMIKPDIACEIE